MAEGPHRLLKIDTRAGPAPDIYILFIYLFFFASASSPGVSFVVTSLRTDLRCSSLNWDLWGALLVFITLKVCSHT